MNRLPSFVFFAFFLIVNLSCEDDGNPAESRPIAYEYTGIVRDEITGHPIRNVNIYVCPRTHFGNATIRIGDKILKGTTDECGHYSIAVAEHEAGYSVHETSVETPVMLLSHPLYGEHIYQKGQSGNQDYLLKTPFLDTLRWSFDETRTTVTIDIRTNDIPYVRYQPFQATQEIQGAEGTVTIVQISPTGQYQYLETFTNVPPGSWVSFSITNVEADASLDLLVASGDITRNGVFKFLIPAGQRPTSYTNILPVDGAECK